MSQRYLGGVITANPTTPTLSAATGVWTMEQQFQNIANWPKSTGLVSRSVRLRSSASGSLSRTFPTAGNTKTWTWSAWVKRGTMGAINQYLFDLGSSQTYIIFNSDNIQVGFYSTNASTLYYITTSQVFRDPSAWYHIVVAIDTTQATAANRNRLYINGVQVTSFSAATYPSQNDVGQINTAALHRIGSYDGSTNLFDGYLTEINFIDGQALTPAYFGFTDGNGVWQPATYSGTYGTNGFYLNFSDNSAATATTIGKDYSGNGNNWTPNNISVTAGTTYDSMLDVPTNYADGGNGRGNYCTLNPLDKNWWVAAVTTQSTISNANLTASCGAVDTKVSSTMSVLGGKFYAEVTVTSVQISNIIVSGYAPSTFEIAYINDGNKSINRTQSAYGASYTAGDIIGIAVDAPNNQVTFYKNGTSQGVITNTFIGDAIFIGLYLYNSNFSINFGQRPFSYTPPTGYVALNTQNLSAPTISNGATVMAATLYTGNGSTQSITNTVNNISFKPDFVWAKSRSAATGHQQFDSVRGVTKYLQSNNTNAEGTDVNTLTAFNSNGFSIGTDTGLNANAATFVAWQWNAGGTTVTNTSGSISAQVRANATAGFSIVTYTGTGSNATVGHGLGVTPSMVIVKARSTTGNWCVTMPTLGSNNVVFLDLTNAAASFPTVFNGLPTSTIFNIGTAGSTNTNAATFVAYCFAAVTGYSAFGSYTGNGSNDGPFIYLGFRPRFLLIKSSTSAENWWLLDSTRDPYNVASLYLHPNASIAESSFATVDFLSNGFKLRYNGAAVNASGATLIYACFAENPFKLSRAR